MVCREDICSADQAVQAAAGVLHHIAPTGDLTMAASSIQQVSTSAVLTCNRTDLYLCWCLYLYLYLYFSLCLYL